MRIAVHPVRTSNDLQEALAAAMRGKRSERVLLLALTPEIFS